MLTDFNDIWLRCTLLNLQQTGVFLSLYGITYAYIMIYKTVKFLSNYVMRCKEELCKTNGQNIQMSDNQLA